MHNSVCESVSLPLSWLIFRRLGADIWHFVVLDKYNFFIICTKGPLFHTVTCTVKDKKAAMQREKQEGVLKETSSLKSNIRLYNYLPCH